jgi:DNA-directed RNA polymerase specialized sigma24 family protein
MSTAQLPPFQAFVDEHRGPVLGFLRRLVGARDAEDCFQETFIAALRAYPHAEGRNMRAWVMTIARNKAIDHHRARARRPLPADPAASGAEPAVVEPFEAVLDGLGGGGEVWDHVAALSPAQRAAVTLRFAADLSYREIGATLECSEAAARRRVHDGLESLRRRLATTTKEDR